MKILLLGANGMLGPHVVKVLEKEHDLILSDVHASMDSKHDYHQINISDLQSVVNISSGMDAIINLSVVREERRLAFDVNSQGCYNVMSAAVENGIKRVINTGPHFTVAGPSYEDYDFAIHSFIPPQPGTYLYAHTKGLGNEICRIFSQNFDINVITLLFYNFRGYDGDEWPKGKDFTPFSVTWEDAANSLKCSLDIELSKLPSKFETFNIFADIPHNKFSNSYAKNVLGWKPTDQLQKYWQKEI